MKANESLVISTDYRTAGSLSVHHGSIKRTSLTLD